ncbi:COX15/CtaA family protein [Brachybacterium tyrofermentans]|uniref:COX15/CtaA family protein n=1 Tax=Brachybacterium tyrofermentans TaxID=47848 RepID=UPI003FD3AB35
MLTPFSWLAARMSVERRSLRLAALAALIASILIVATGATVRVTGSGLGCETWPYCTSDTLTPTREMGLHGAIEFGNRLLTVVLCVIVGWLIIAARLQRTPTPSVTRWAWAQFWVVMLNAVIGGITVWTELNPYVVAGHFIAAMLLVGSATVAWHRVAELDRDDPPELRQPTLRTLGTSLFTATAILIVLGTLVTGTGPHAGDSSDVPRMPFDWVTVSRLHAAAAMVVTALAAWAWIVTRRHARSLRRRHARALLLVVLFQGGIGVVQVVLGLPEAVIVLHLLGSALVWIGAIRFLLVTRQPTDPRTPPEASRRKAPCPR